MNERSYDTQTPEAAPTRPQGSFWGEIVRFAFITIIIVVPFRLYVAQPFIVSGASMDPTFADGEYLIVDQISQRVSEPKRESVIIFKYPNDTTKFFIKRIIGLPGETIEIKDGKITVFSKMYPGGLKLDEPYIADSNKKTDDLTVVLNKDEYFVLGDNRLGSSDSRSWGPVPEHLIIGRPLVRLLPIQRLGVLPGDFSGTNSDQ
jgi:signal peptidase I